MNILIDIGHPAHVHLFRCAAKVLREQGHHVFFSTRDIPVAKRLMDCYGLEYVCLGRKKNSMLGKIATVISQDVQLLRFVKKNKIDLGLCSGIALPHVSKLSSMKAFVFDDDDDEAEHSVVKYEHPFASAVMTPEALVNHRSASSAIFYKGTHELAYLHPNRFSPDLNVLQKAGLQQGERFFILRFVAFNAFHDAAQSGLSLDQKRRLIDLLKPYGRVIITSERAIEPEFEQYRLPVPPEDIHSLMYYSSMFLGDSQTMTSEAAILGVPALKCNTFAGRLSVPNELEQKYGLCYAYLPSEFDKFFDHAKRLLEDANTKQLWQHKRQRFLADKIDVTAFFVWFIENYPESKRLLSDNPDYQLRFK